ncbi:LytR/AlgR family response regulator transcription factor [Lacrimispora sp.]|uniref:LytR/AlgR family response regulator transcription factor n=1 Tax=Lacrimispora sp. TaxID=2719234 RepID=UPI00285F1418|nr:LytTR family DNA-binding domain-containing protein [Lacrimispora sp.]MDR7810519.1 LytTR family DNA-binding domain-containing protein [Lacrimispora sp.]
MKIAICDDCRDDIRQLKECIRESKFCPQNQEFCEYSSGEALLADYRGFDIVFLDMKIGEGMNGTLTAQNIRKRDTKVIIVFYSDFESPASRISSVRPYDYLLKRYSKEELSQSLGMVLEEVLNKEELPKLPVVCDGKVFILQISDIIYVQIYKKGSQIWLTDKKAEEIWGGVSSEKELKQTIETKTKLKEYYQELRNYGFIYASESYIINAEKVVSRQKDFVRMEGGHNLTVVRRMKKVFDEELGKYYGVRYIRERIKKE